MPHSAPLPLRRIQQPMAAPVAPLPDPEQDCDERCALAEPELEEQDCEPTSVEGAEPGTQRGRNRISVRQRNNRRIQEVKDRARILKRLQVECSLSEWDSLLRHFALTPCCPATAGSDGSEELDHTEVEQVLRDRCGRYACLRPRDVQQRGPLTIEVNGLTVGCRSARTSKEGACDGELLDIGSFGIDWGRLRQALYSPQDFERLIDEHVRRQLGRQAHNGHAEPTVRLGFYMFVKLKVELFETTLPMTKEEAPAIHSYAGPKRIRAEFLTIPDYVPDDCFLDLNAQAQCWVAKTSVVRGIVQMTHYQVGPDHCFMPGETVFFRNNNCRFKKPVWVVSAHEERAFSRLGVSFLVKRTLKRGDRFILLPAFDRGEIERDNWRHILEEEVITDLLEHPDRPGPGVITQETANYFGLADPGRKVRIAHCDCTCLTVEVKYPAIIGRPLESEFSNGIPIQLDDPRSLPEIRHYMDLRGRLGFNAMGLLHNGSADPDTANCWVECPLNRLSVMEPTSRLLFLDHWRDEQEQKAFRKVLEKIQEDGFLTELC